MSWYTVTGVGVGAVDANALVLSRVANATLVSGISTLEYNQIQTGTISIDSASTYFGFGAGYIPTDATYYKNKTYDQSELSMFVETQTSAAPILLTSPLNPTGAGYTLEFSNPTTVGTVTTWDWEFTPNANFITLMDGRNDGDRLFYIWAAYRDWETDRKSTRLNSSHRL